MLISLYSLTEMYPERREVFPLIRHTAIAALIAISLLAILNYNALAQDDVEGEDPVAVFNRAQDIHEKGDLVEAIKLYEKAIKILPEFPEAEYQRGVAYLALGKNNDAETAFRRAVELRADWSLAQTSLASLLVNKGEYVESAKLLAKVLESEPQNPPALTAMIDLRLRTNATHPQLRDLLATIVPLTGKANPTVSLWNARAALESMLGLSRDAKASLSNALLIDPKNRNALFQLADIAVAEGDIVKANELLKRLDNGSPSTDPLRLLKANIFAFDGKFEEAITQLDAVTLPGPSAKDLRKRITAIRTTNPAELEKQLENDARNATILGRLCSLYRRENPAKALAFCRRANEAEPTNMNHAIGYGAALVQAKQFDAAVSILKKIVAIVPDNATAHANLATALFQLKRYSEAKEQFDWLTTAQPRAAGAYLFLGIVHDELTEYMDAAAHYQQYLRLADPVENKLDIEKVNLRMPQIQKLIKEGKGKKK